MGGHLALKLKITQMYTYCFNMIAMLQIFIFFPNTLKGMLINQSYLVKLPSKLSHHPGKIKYHRSKQTIILI